MPGLCLDSFPGVGVGVRGEKKEPSETRGSVYEGREQFLSRAAEELQWT